MQRDNLLRGFMQITRTGVITQPGPQMQNFIQRRMDTTGQLCAVLDLPVAAAELCRTVAALAAEHGVTMAFSGDAALSRVTLRGPAQDVLAALQALSVYFPGKSCRISG